jgi:hypothetical protein
MVPMEQCLIKKAVSRFGQTGGPRFLKYQNILNFNRGFLPEKLTVFKKRFNFGWQQEGLQKKAFLTHFGDHGMLETNCCFYTAPSRSLFFYIYLQQLSGSFLFMGCCFKEKK